MMVAAVQLKRKPNTLKEKSMMTVKNPKELFITILSHVRHGTERSVAVYKELGDLAQNPEIQEALGARAFVSQQTLAKLDEAFSLIGEKPVSVSGRLHDVFVEDFRKELAEIQSQETKTLIVLAKANYISHPRAAGY
jgi:hypothetical protein